MFVLCLLIACAIHANAHGRNESVRAVKDYVLDAGVFKVPVERRLFNFRRNGVKIDVKVVPSIKDESSGDKNDDYFPEFPVKDIGKCIIEFSLGCVRKRFVRYLKTVGHLDEITLLGQDVKLVRSGIARSDGRTARNDSDISIERSVDDLFDSFTLRITLPRWNSKRERNQIDVMLDETAVTEGRGKKGGGGGGGKGGKCKMMMMGMFMMIKMKLMGVAALKGLMMGSMSLMVSMMMLMQKFGKGGGGPWQSGGGPWQSSGGPWQGGGNGQLKEIVLVTKSSNGGSGCCSGGDSYGAPPPSSYGPPSGGGYGGGGGWGRSFRRQSMTLSRDKTIKTETANETDPVPAIGEVIANGESIDYPDYQELPMIATSNSTASNWNATHDVREKETANLSNSIKHNPSKVNTKGRSFVFNDGPPTGIIDGVRGDVDSASSANKPDMDHEKNILGPTYTDEWQTTAEKISSITETLLGSDARPESPRDSRVKDIPLLRDI